MPIYEFSCNQCGNFQLVQSMNEEHSALCPQCKSLATRIYSPVSVIFKGVGFPGNDMKRKDVRDPSVSTEEKKERSKKAKKILKDFDTKQNKKLY